MKTITIKKEDVIPYVYFVCGLAQQAKAGVKYAKLSTKSDLIGGVFDRWINIIPESVSFNQYFIPKALEKLGEEKKVEVYSDFYVYDPNKVGIAPDVLGLKIDGKIVPFAKYDDTKGKKQFWDAQGSCPQIEVKSFFGRKYMVSLRDQNYGDKYLVMIGAGIDADYLLSFFDSSIFSEDYTAKLNMPDDFIASNEKELLLKTPTVEFDRTTLGKIEILGVTTATEFKKIALKLSAGDIPRYFKDIKPRTRRIKEEQYKYKIPLSHYCDKQPSGLYRFNKNWYQLFDKEHEKTLDIEVDKPEALIVINKTSNAITVLAEEDAFINGNKKDNKFEKGKQYNINFATFGPVAGEEYFLNKGVLHYLPNLEDKLVDTLAEIIKNN